MKTTRPSHPQLVERARQGDEAAFAALVELCTPALFRIVRRMVVDTQEAESIMQETFWRFWNAMPRYKADRPLLPYLAAIASNLARDHYRRERRLEDVDVEDVLESRPAEEDPEGTLEQQDIRERLSRAVSTLPFAYRAVISLRYEADMSYEEIATTLSLPLNTVRTRLRRAKDLLRQEMEKLNDG